jgi:hypothetical protein
MRISEAIEAQRNRQRRLCNVLGLDPDVTSDVILNLAEERVEWTRRWEDIDVNAYEWYRAECTLPSLVTVGLYAGRGVAIEQWRQALKIDGHSLRQFLTVAP